ncbi:MAG: M90 family metallopeptidase [Myxococcota bacterium]
MTSIPPSVPPPFAPLALAFALALGALAGLFAWLVGATPAGAVATGALGAGVAYAIATRRDRRRRRIAAAPFPAAWRKVLEGEVAYYRDLEAPERARFEREVAYFLAEQRIAGPRGAAVADDLRVLVAASAVVLAFGRPGYRYPTARDVVVYDDAFSDDYAVDAGGPILGMVHQQGPILFSAKALRQGFRGERDGLNVGYHELAHVLDFDGGPADGVPSMMPFGSIGPWTRLMSQEYEKNQKRRRARRKDVLRQYAFTNEAEFFAVATEVFFEQPRKLKGKHPELYGLLVETYGQDPAA